MSEYISTYDTPNLFSGFGRSAPAISFSEAAPDYRAVVIAKAAINAVPTLAPGVATEQKRRLALVTQRQKLWYELETRWGHTNAGVKKALTPAWRAYLGGKSRTRPAIGMGSPPTLSALKHWNNMDRGKIARAKKAIADYKAAAAKAKLPTKTPVIKQTMLPVQTLPPDPVIVPQMDVMSEDGGMPIMLYAGIGAVVLGGLWFLRRKKK